MLKAEKENACMCFELTNVFFWFQCKPLNGFGFQRGGYICECRPNYRYPEYIQGPYLGVAIERATEEEHKAGFHCIKSEGEVHIDVETTLLTCASLIVRVNLV